MQLRSLLLRNFCQHVDTTVEFAPGPNWILGANSSGKSNAIKGGRFACIGESGNEGAKINDLNWQAAANGESGFVELHFDIQGQPGKIRRSINATRASLKLGSEKAINSSNAATAKLLEISGVSRRVIEDIVFVLQGELESILFERPSDRAKKLQSLFGIENVEKLRQLLHQEAALITTDPADDRIKELQTQLDEQIDPQLKQLNDDRTQLQQLLDTEDIEALVKRVEAWEQYQKDTKRLAELKKRSDELNAANLNGEVKAMEARAAELEKRKQELQTAADDARATLASVKQARTVAAAKANLETELQRIEAVLKEPEPAAPPVGWQQVHDSQKQVAIARERVDRTERYLALFHRHEVGYCELCGQALQFTEDRIVEAEHVLAEQPKMIKAVEAAIKTSEELLRTYEAEYARHGERVKEAFDSQERVQKQLAEMADSPMVDVDEDAAERLVADFDDCIHELDELKQGISEWREKLARKDGELQSISEQISGLMVVAPCTEDEAEAAKATQQSVTEAQHKQAGIDGQLRQLHAARVRTLAELEGLKQQAGSMEAKRKYKQLCVDAREVLHRDVLPQLVMRQYLSALNAELNKYLQIFNVPFSCTITDELDVICRINGFPDKPAARLSGGQRVMLGIAFRFAIFSLFAAKLGFVVLDEPTVYLDGNNIDVIADMMRSVRSHVLSSGLQLIVITHEARLASPQDNIIQF
jgi:exonuclease SbcC